MTQEKLLELRSGFDDLKLNIIHSSRKSIALEMKPGMITVRAPKGMSRREIDAFLESKRRWIEKHLSKMQERQEILEKVEPFTMAEIHELADKALVMIPERVKKYACLLYTSPSPRD